MNCKPKSLQVRVFHVYLRDAATATYHAVGRIEVIGDATPAQVLEMYGIQNQADWYTGLYFADAYDYLIQEEGSETVTALTVSRRQSFDISPTD